MRSTELVPNFFRYLRDTLGMRPPPSVTELDPIVIDDLGWMSGTGIVLRPSHPSWYNSSAVLKTMSRDPVGILWHFSATRAGTALAMARKRQRKLNPKKDRVASWHLSIETDGVIVQMAPLIRRTWHCRADRGTIDAGRGPVPVTWALIGVELIGFGDDYSQAQVVAAERLMRAGAKQYSWRREHVSWEHRHFDPERRRDCGPPWSNVYLPLIRDRVYGAHP